MRFRELYRKGEEALRTAGVPDASYDALELLCRAFSMDRAVYLARLREEAPEGGEARYEALIRRRADREPLQHILGYTEFMGLRFELDRHVLIPRADTETLTELVLNENPSARLSVLDLCTGSGCIGISLKKLGGYDEVLCSDVSAEALALARKNAARICGENGGPSFRLSDMFEHIPESFDLIVSNPPYIRREDIRQLEPEVREGDPLLALDGGEDGLDYYRIIAAEAKRHLNEGGRLYLEMGFDQGPALEALFSEAGFRDVQIIRDAAGLPRIIKAC